MSDIIMTSPILGYLNHQNLTREAIPFSKGFLFIHSYRIFL